MKVAFAGSPPAAVPALRALHASRHEVVLVVTQPQKARGRSGRPTPTAVGAAAEELGLPVVAPPSINADEPMAALDASGAGVLCVVAFGQILRAPLLAARPCINVHFSLLPAYRGAAPVERAIMDGRDETGVTIMRMDEGLDTGPMISSWETPIGPEEDAGALVSRLADAGAGMLVEAVDAIEAGTLRLTPQPQEGVSIARKITDEDRPLDLARPARELADRVRALSPHVGATLDIDGSRYKVWRARPRPDSPGPGLHAERGAIVAGCGDGALEILELQPPGRGRMDAGAFLRGFRGRLEIRAAAQ
ncbi:MAG: methionyl-tRNA formyltransferase [Actinomycetota bacterium]